MLSRFYWDTYSLAYDLVDNLYPHKEIIVKISDIFAKKSPAKILDAGCGTGNLIATLNEKMKDSTIYGVDISYSMLQRAYRKLERKNNNEIKFFNIDISKGLPFPDEFFDGIACVHVINYLDKPRFVCKEFERTLKNGGDLILVSFKEKLPLTRFKESHSNLIKCLNFDYFRVISLPLLYVILTLCNLPIRVGLNLKYYDENDMKKIVGKNLRNVEACEVYLGCSTFIHYTKSI
jgi:ubiquinone/menaquinone biosynthesis C-methylase UbiE